MTWGEPASSSRVFRLKRAGGQENEQPHFLKPGLCPTDLGLVSGEGTRGLHNSIVGILAAKTKLSFLTQLPPPSPYSSPPQVSLLSVSSAQIPSCGTLAWCQHLGQPAGGTLKQLMPVSSFPGVFGEVISLLFIIIHVAYSQ